MLDSSLIISEWFKPSSITRAGATVIKRDAATLFGAGSLNSFTHIGFK
jgi:hypothetical protein